MLTHHRAIPRRLLIATTGLALAAASLTAVASPASADTTTTTVTVVGTSDVSDSNLVQSVIAPGFQAAYPQYTLNYVPKGTGAAIKYAEAGSADALIVHAPSQENQFVAGGYSLEKYGRAIFYGDYVLAGGTADPAGVAANDSNDIVQAFEDVAAKGAMTDANGNPEAHFISRGGAPPPGTVTQEDAIWALTTGVPTCQVSAANGGGAMPSTTDIGQACPSTPTPPAWYTTTGLTQGPNINYANTCNFAPNTENNCYVFTDRGTYDYLQSGGTSTSPTVKPTNLTILTRYNKNVTTTSNGLLINTFHAYAVNPQTTGVPTLNTAGATALLNWITSPTAQTAIGEYLKNADPSGAPFLPDAAPQVTVSQPPTSVTAGKSFTLTGSLTNRVPGTPPLAGIKVTLAGTPTSAPKSLAQSFSGTTDASGKFSIKVSPTLNQLYTLTTPAIPGQLEYPDLSPQFFDQLASTSTLEGGIAVKSVVQGLSASGSSGHLTTKGQIVPRRVGGNSHLSLYARPSGTKQAFSYRGRVFLEGGYTSFSVTFPLAKGKWDYYLTYANPGYVTSTNSATKTATVK